MGFHCLDFSHSILSSHFSLSNLGGIGLNHSQKFKNTNLSLCLVRSGNWNVSLPIASIHRDCASEFRSLLETLKKIGDKGTTPLNQPENAIDGKIALPYIFFLLNWPCILFTQKRKEEQWKIYISNSLVFYPLLQNSNGLYWIILTLVH